jgi:single-strand DNA-binding protein
LSLEEIIYKGEIIINKVILLGRLVKDPEVRNTQNNTMVCSFSLAVNRRFKQEGQPDADFINIVAWNKTAEFVAKYFAKGQQVAVVGRIQTRNYDDKDGKKVYVTEVVAEEVHFAESKRQDNNTGFEPVEEFTPVAQEGEKLPF